jgi:putative flippase GtrA
LTDTDKDSETRPLKRLGGEAGRYFLVSLIALATDFGLLYILREGLGLEILTANAISFSTGAFVAYVGSVRWVFRHRRLNRPYREFLVFFVIGLGGLAVNEAVLWGFTAFSGLPWQISKGFAAGSSFVFNFVVRKWLLFRQGG